MAQSGRVPSAECSSTARSGVCLSRQSSSRVDRCEGSCAGALWRCGATLLRVAGLPRSRAEQSRAEQSRAEQSRAVHNSACARALGRSTRTGAAGQRRAEQPAPGARITHRLSCSQLLLLLHSPCTRLALALHSASRRTRPLSCSPYFCNALSILSQQPMRRRFGPVSACCIRLLYLHSGYPTPNRIYIGQVHVHVLLLSLCPSRMSCPLSLVLVLVPCPLQSRYTHTPT